MWDEVRQPTRGSLPFRSIRKGLNTSHHKIEYYERQNGTQTSRLDIGEREKIRLSQDSAQWRLTWQLA